jgi:hypothetical protein
VTFDEGGRNLGFGAGRRVDSPEGRTAPNWLVPLRRLRRLALRDMPELRRRIASLTGVLAQARRHSHLVMCNPNAGRANRWVTAADAVSQRVGHSLE